MKDLITLRTISTPLSLTHQRKIGWVDLLVNKIPNFTIMIYSSRNCSSSDVVIEEDWSSPLSKWMGPAIRINGHTTSTCTGIGPTG